MNQVVYVPTAMLESDINNGAFQFYKKLLKIAGDKKHVSLGNAKLAEAADCSIRTVSRRIKSLTEHGFIKVYYHGIFRKIFLQHLITIKTIGEE